MCNPSANQKNSLKQVERYTALRRRTPVGTAWLLGCTILFIAPQHGWSGEALAMQKQVFWKRDTYTLPSLWKSCGTETLIKIKGTRRGNRDGGVRTHDILYTLSPDILYRLGVSGCHGASGSQVAASCVSASGRRTLAALCEEYGISRPTGYLWVKRYRESGLSGIAVRFI